MKKKLLKYKAPGSPKGELKLKLFSPIWEAIDFKKDVSALPFGKGFSRVLHFYRGLLGWAYAENCKFYANTGPASIWHDGSGKVDFKTVLVNCFFDGFEGFNLGRYHKDAQFYLINCRFSKNMADKDIYLVPTTNILQFGRRVYYFNCHRTGGDFTWFKDNLSAAEGSPSANKINASWVFRNKWNPENSIKLN